MTPLFPQRIALVLAHQDDEIGVLWLLKKLRNEQKEIDVFYLTNGRTPQQPEDLVQRRSLESRSALQFAGLKGSNIFEIGKELSVNGEYLHEALNPVWEQLKSHFQPKRYDLTITHVFEGGNQDHDSCAILCHRLQTENLTGKVIGFPLYSGENSKGMFFKVLDQRLPQLPAIKIKMSLIENLFFLRSMFFYPSQKKTWLFLLPGFLKYIFFHRNFTFYEVRADKFKWNDIPLFERHKRVTRQHYFQKMKDFGINLES